ncbi:MAG TPA: tetratricopeptide repeat protein, partial [Anaerolineales bacterium]
GTAHQHQAQQDHEHGDPGGGAHQLVARLAQQSGQRAGDPASAIQSIQAALAAWPDEPRWHALAAEICLGHSHSGEAGAPDLDSAIAHLQEAARLEPGYAPHALALGQVYLEAGDLPHAIQVLEQATRTAPDQPEAWLALAQAQQLAGDLNQAANSAERAIERSTDPIGPLLLRGELALQTNNPRGAQSRAQAVLRLNPDEPSGLFLQARALAALGRPEEALASLERAAPLAKNPLPMQLERASLLRRTQGPDKALKALQGLAESYPEDPAVLSTLAEALLEYGQNEAALHTARLALQADNNQLSPEEQANLHYLVGRQLRRAGQLDQAVHHLSEATRHNPAALEAYLELGRTHQDRRQPAQALNVYQQTIQAAPGDPRAYYQAGMVLKESKDYLGAESMLRKAAELAPTDVSIHRLLGAVVALNLVHNRRQPAQ